MKIYVLLKNNIFENYNAYLHTYINSLVEKNGYGYDVLYNLLLVILSQTSPVALKLT